MTLNLDSAASLPVDASQRVYAIAVTVPPGTLPSNPQVTPWVTEDNVIVSIELEVPPGHNGLTGIRIAKGGNQILPFSAGTWIIANDYVHTYELRDQLPTSDMAIQAYNQGAYTHTFYLRMSVTNFYPPPANTGVTETDVLPLGQSDVLIDPTSPDVVLGPDTTQALLNGTVTPGQLTPIPPPSPSS